MTTVDERGYPVTSLGGWDITLYGRGILCERSSPEGNGTPGYWIDIVALHVQPANLRDLFSLDSLVESLLGLSVESRNRLFDWIRCNLGMAREASQEIDLTGIDEEVLELVLDRIDEEYGEFDRNLRRVFIVHLIQAHLADAVIYDMIGRLLLGMYLDTLGS